MYLVSCTSTTIPIPDRYLDNDHDIIFIMPDARCQMPDARITDWLNGMAEEQRESRERICPIHHILPHLTSYLLSNPDPHRASSTRHTQPVLKDNSDNSHQRKYKSIRRLPLANAQRHDISVHRSFR